MDFTECIVIAIVNEKYRTKTKTENLKYKLPEIGLANGRQQQLLNHRKRKKSHIFYQIISTVFQKKSEKGGGVFISAEYKEFCKSQNAHRKRNGWKSKTSYQTFSTYEQTQKTELV